jgi:hypothetical protein
MVAGEVRCCWELAAGEVLGRMEIDRELEGEGLIGARRWCRGASEQEIVQARRIAGGDLRR